MGIRVKGKNEGNGDLYAKNGIMCYDSTIELPEVISDDLESGADDTELLVKIKRRAYAMAKNSFLWGNCVYIFPEKKEVKRDCTNCNYISSFAETCKTCHAYSNWDCRSSDCKSEKKEDVDWEGLKPRVTGDHHDSLGIDVKILVLHVNKLVEVVKSLSEQVKEIKKG